MVETPKPLVHVVAGIIVNSNDEILIAKRPQHLDQGGLWEFPGGKREDNESSSCALARELFEELDIVAEPGLRTIELVHEYPKKIVCLEFFEVTRWDGQARGKEGQSICWVAKNELAQFDFPAANEAVLRALKFPRVILRARASIDSTVLLERLEYCLTLGFSTLYFSPGRLSVTKHAHLCRRVYDLCEKYQGQLLLDVPLESLADFPSAGLHLGAARLHEFSQRPVPHERLFTCECTNIDDLKLAKLINADAVLLSSGGNLAGREISLDSLDHKQFLKSYSVPRFMLGQLNVDDFRNALDAGCYGIADATDILSAAVLVETEKNLKDIAREANIKPRSQ